MTILRTIHSPFKYFIRPIHDFVNNQISYRFGLSNDPLIPLTIPEVLLKSVERSPDKHCIISNHQNIIKTYQDLEQDSNKLANGLSELGVTRFDPIGIWSGNCYEWIVCQFATAKLGAILVNINPGYKEDELEYCLNLIGVKMIICNQRYKSSNYVDIINNVAPNVINPTIRETKTPTLKKVIFLDDFNEEIAPKNSLKLTELINSSRSDHVSNSKITFDDPINVQFTSGTTGSPKGATLTHFGVVNNAYFSGKRFFQGLQEVKVCLPNPLYHCFGSINGSLQTIIHNGTLILSGFVANPKTTLDAINKYKPDIVYGTPTMFTDIANEDVDKFDTSSVKRFLMSGAPCPVELLTKLTTKIFPKSSACIPYGTTETSPVITSTDPVNHDAKYLVNTVGTVLDHIEIKLADPVTGDVVKIGERGEVMTRGYHTFLGYFNQQDKTNEVLDVKKWYHTGDIAIMNEDGFVSIVGRNKDMIIRGGENIYPREIEDFLLKYDIIADVNVVGVPDIRMGEEVCACLILKPEVVMSEKVLKEKIVAFCKGKIAHFKIPKHVLLMDEFPRTVTMKIQKNKLRLIACERLKIKDEE